MFNLFGNLLSKMIGIPKCLLRTDKCNGVRPLAFLASKSMAMLLYIVCLYINDLPDVTNMLTILFADDTNCIVSGNNLKILEKQVNDELIKIKDFMMANKLSLNTSKTTFTIISPPNKTPKDKITLKIGKEVIKETDEFSFLGIIIDKNLKFKSHFNKVLAKVKNGVNALSSIKKTLNYRSKIMIYHSLIHSHLNYCSLSWLPKLNTKQLDTLITLQKRAIRAIFNSKYNSHTNILFQYSHITKVEDICEAESLKMMYQYKEGLLPFGVSQTIKKFTEASTFLTRSNATPKITIRGLRKDDILYEMITYWNKCNLEIKDQTYKMPSVKQRIKGYLRKRYNFNCHRQKCFSCFRTNETALLEYMKN